MYSLLTFMFQLGPVHIRLKHTFLIKLSFRLDQYSKATTLVHQLFGGYFRSQGEDLNVNVFMEICL